MVALSIVVYVVAGVIKTRSCPSAAFVASASAIESCWRNESHHRFRFALTIPRDWFCHLHKVNNATVSFIVSRLAIGSFIALFWLTESSRRVQQRLLPTFARLHVRNIGDQLRCASSAVRPAPSFVSISGASTGRRPEFLHGVG